MTPANYAGTDTGFGIKVAAHECHYDVSLLVTATELNEKPYLAKGRTIVQIDTLRNSSAITVALAAGAESVRLFGKGEDGLADLRFQADRFNGPALLAGEVEGQPIDGFDCGNSPREFTRERVAGRHIFYASTNNGRALENVRGIGGRGKVVWGCMLNGQAVGRAMAQAVIQLPLLFLCAGFRGTLAKEDLICAGQIMLSAQYHGLDLRTLDDGATVAYRLGQSYFNPNGTVTDAEALCTEMREWRCGSVLALLNQEADIDATVTGAGIDDDVVAIARTCIPMLNTESADPIIKRFLFNYNAKPITF
ncbi:MAG: 2-phosphosulfolactate phosphatase [Candidatus Zixiibacteriota bacterium]